jgi:hypothetical protein
MPTQACCDNIKKETPPVYCDNIVPGLCGRIQDKINKYCSHNGLGGDVPVPQSPEAGDCWCCCSCFAYGTPIEVDPKLYQMIEDIVPGQEVLATDASLSRWVKRRVTELGGMAPETQLDFMAYSQFKLADHQVRILITTADHLFLLPTGKLMPVQDLRPGDEVRQANGEVARVEVMTWLQFDGGVRHISLGEWRRGDPLDGHLINSNGLVTADLAVQLDYYGGGLTEHMAPDEPASERPPVGSLEFYRKYDTTAYDAFVNDPEAWPANSQPIGPSLLNVPPSALAYLTPEQAADIAAAAAGTQSLGDSAKLALTRYLFQLHSAWHHQVYFIVDWANQLPNAWYFQDFKRDYIVLTGGLVRLNQLGREGLAIVLSHLVARLQGAACTGDADYDGVLLYLRQMWYGAQFLPTFHEGYRQIAEVFGLISPEHRRADPGNICRQPSIDCRLETLRAAAASGDLPECAVPVPLFAVTGARAGRLTEVVVSFSQTLNPPSAVSPRHYVFEPEATVLTAEPAGQDVTLATEALLPGTDYTLTIRRVRSDHGAVLKPGHDQITVHTPDQ